MTTVTDQAAGEQLAITTEDRPPAPAKKAPAKKATAAKKATGDRPPAGRTKKGRPSASDKLAEQLAGTLAVVFGTAAAASMGINEDGEPEALPGSFSRDLSIIAGQAEPLARALVKVSERNEPLRRVLTQLTTASDYSSLASVLALGIVLPILANHGLLPDTLGPLFGASTPAPDAPPAT